MDAPQLRRQLRTAVGSLLALALVVVAIFGWSMRQLVVADRWVDHTREVQTELEGILAAVTDAETRVRGYVVTGEPDFAPQSGVFALPLDRLAHLRELVSDNPEQAARVPALTQAVRAKLAFNAETVRIRREQGFDAARSRVAAGEGRELMEQVRQQVGEMSATEGRLLKERSQRADRSDHWVLAAGIVLGLFLIGAGAVAYRFLHREIVARYEAERLSRLGEERFRLMVAAVRDYAIYALDAHGNVTTWNPGAERNKGYKAEEIIGKHFSIFYPPEEAAAGKPAQELELAAAQGRVEDEGWRVRKDGSRFWANVVVSAIRNESGELVGFTKVTRDLTERRKFDQQREALIERLERSNRELQDFAMIASHDLQEPLRKIQMFGDALQEQYGEALPEQARDFLRRMQSAAARGQSLVLGLLAYSRVTSKAQPFVPVDLAKVATEVVSDLEGRIAKEDGKVELGPLPTIDGDPLQMRQLLQNLIGNALKFHKPDAAPVIQVSARALDGGEVWELRVADNGIGFDAKYLDRIFKLFQRLHDRGKYEGAGMGLAICRKIVERHRGEITAESAPGAGATFVIRLPSRQTNQEIAA